MKAQDKGRKVIQGTVNGAKTGLEIGIGGLAITGGFLGKGIKKSFGKVNDAIVETKARQMIRIAERAEEIRNKK